MDSYLQALAWNCCMTFFPNLPELWHLIYAKILFQLNILKPIDRILPNFIYALILTRYSLGLLHIILAPLYQSYGP